MGLMYTWRGTQRCTGLMHTGRGPRSEKIFMQTRRENPRMNWLHAD